MKHLVVYEKTVSSVGAYVPDLPGCVAVGETQEESEQLIREAIRVHIDAMREDRLPVPPPSTSAELIDVA